EVAVSPPKVSKPSATGIRLTDAHKAWIQDIANQTRQRITLFGSRVTGANELSDYDYILSGPSRARGQARRLLPRGLAGGEVSASGRETGIDIWQDYNPKAPGYKTLPPNTPHIVFEPKK